MIVILRILDLCFFIGDRKNGILSVDNIIG